MDNSEQVVSDCADLTMGDHVSVWRHGRLCHAERRLLDLSEVQVTRTVKPAWQEPQKTRHPDFLARKAPVRPGHPTHAYRQHHD